MFFLYSPFEQFKLYIIYPSHHNETKIKILCNIVVATFIILYFSAVIKNTYTEFAGMIGFLKEQSITILFENLITIVQSTYASARESADIPELLDKRGCFSIKDIYGNITFTSVLTSKPALCVGGIGGLVGILYWYFSPDNGALQERIFPPVSGLKEIIQPEQMFRKFNNPLLVTTKYKDQKITINQNICELKVNKSNCGIKMICLFTKDFCFKVNTIAPIIASNKIKEDKIIKTQ